MLSEDVVARRWRKHSARGDVRAEAMSVIATICTAHQPVQQKWRRTYRSEMYWLPPKGTGEDSSQEWDKHLQRLSG